MKLREELSQIEREELQNIMRNEPVFTGDILCYQAAAALWLKGLVARNRDGDWVADWTVIRSGGRVPPMNKIRLAPVQQYFC
jgi:hypothetical protein